MRGLGFWGAGFRLSASGFGLRGSAALCFVVVVGIEVDGAEGLEDTELAVALYVFSEGRQ